MTGAKPLPKLSFSPWLRGNQILRSAQNDNPKILPEEAEAFMAWTAHIRLPGSIPLNYAAYPSYRESSIFLQAIIFGLPADNLRSSCRPMR